MQRGEQVDVLDEAVIQPLLGGQPLGDQPRIARHAFEVVASFRIAGMGQVHCRLQRGQQGVNVGALVVDDQAGQVAEHVQLAQQRAVEYPDLPRVEEDKAEEVAVDAHRQGVTGAVTGLQQGLHMHLVAVLQHAEIVDHTRCLAVGHRLEPGRVLELGMVIGQGVVLVLHRDEGLYPVAAVVIQSHGQTLYLGVLVLQCFQQVAQLGLKRPLFLQVMQMGHGRSLDGSINIV